MKEQTDNTLEVLSRLIDGGDTDAMLWGASDLLVELLRKFRNELYVTNDPITFDRDLVLRCIACKAYELWTPIVALTRTNQAYAALPLLRPLTEEMIFAHFLLTLPAEDVSEYLLTKARLEVFEKHIAQAEFFPAIADQFAFHDVALEPPNSELIARTRAFIKDSRDRLRGITGRADWPKGGGRTVRDMARAVGMETYYDFIYRGSSSAVHASLHELGRMVWTDRSTGTTRITFETFEQYYRRFVLVYGGWVASHTVLTLSSHFPGEFLGEDLDSLSVIMAFFIKPSVIHQTPGLVTLEELNGPSTL